MRNIIPNIFDKYSGNAVIAWKYKTKPNINNKIVKAIQKTIPIVLSLFILYILYSWISSLFFNSIPKLYLFDGGRYA